MPTAGRCCVHIFVWPSLHLIISQPTRRSTHGRPRSREESLATCACARQSHWHGSIHFERMRRDGPDRGSRDDGGHARGEEHAPMTFSTNSTRVAPTVARVNISRPQKKEEGGRSRKYTRCTRDDAKPRRAGNSARECVECTCVRRCAHGTISRRKLSRSALFCVVEVVTGGQPSLRSMSGGIKKGFFF